MKKFDAKALRWTLLGLLALSAILFIALAFAGLSALSSQSSKLVSLKAQSQAADVELSNLEETKKQVEKYSYFKSVAQSVIPNDKDQAAAVLEINQLADKAGIIIQNIAFPASNLGLGTSSLGGAISQAEPVSGIPGLYSLELTITPATGSNIPANKRITYDKMLTFLKEIENDRHTAQITQVDIQQSDTASSLSFNLSINIFIRPQQ